MQPPESSRPQSSAGASSRTIRGLPAGIWALGFVSLLMDASSELIHWVAVVPALLAVGLLVFAVHEPERVAGNSAVRPPVKWTEARRLPSGFWWLVGLGVVLLLAASVLAGLLWNQYGASATFLTGCGFALLAAIGLWRWEQGRASCGGMP